MRRRTTITGLVQGIILGAVLAFITANPLINAEVKAMQTTVNDWSITLKCGVSGDNILQRAACAKDIPTTNLPEEVGYWTETVDSAAHTLNGQHNYLLHFSPGESPPSSAPRYVGEAIILHRRNRSVHPCLGDVRTM